MAPRVSSSLRAFGARIAPAAILAALLLATAPCARSQVISNDRIGSPAFELVDMHSFAAPYDASAAVDSVMNRILPPPNHGATGAGTPGAPHPGPYDHELADGIAAAGYREGYVFGATDFTEPQGIYHVVMIIPSPGAPTGSSPDYASGPILANDLFPIVVHHEISRNGAAAFSAWRMVPLPASWAYGGASHVPNAAHASRNSLGLPSPLGEYVYTRTITDRTMRNGWQTRIALRVLPDSAIPEPGTLVLAATGLFSCAAIRKRRAHPVS